MALNCVSVTLQSTFQIGNSFNFHNNCEVDSSIIPILEMRKKSLKKDLGRQNLDLTNSYHTSFSVRLK